jgi:hypothetical protein
MSSVYPERAYYNIRLENDGSSDDFTFLADFKETRVQPILSEPNKYELAIARFKIPSAIIPLIVKTRENQYTLEIEYDGQSIEKEIFLGNPGLGTLGPYGPAYYSYTSISSDFTRACKEAFDELKLLKPGLPGVPPFMTYTAEDELYRIYYDPTWKKYSSPPSLPELFPPILRINTAFAKLIISFNLSYVSTIPSNNNWIFPVIDRRTNLKQVDGNDYIVMSQEYSTVGLISQWDSVIIATDSIPVASEKFTTFQTIDSNGVPQGVPSGSENIVRNIITDFHPISGLADRSYLQYFAPGVKRWVSLLNADELRTIDVNILWSNYEGRVYPLYLQPGDICTIKLEFRRVGLKS